MAKIAEAYVELKARMDNLKKGLSKAQTSTRKAMAKMTMAVRGFANATKAAMGAAKIALLAFAGALAGVLYLTAQQEKAENKLAAVMKATGNAAGFTTKQMLDMASAYQTLTAFGDEAIINAQALMSTFLNIGGKVFIDAMEAAMDLARVFDQDLKQSVLQLGIALNDPVLGYTRLRRVGVSFSDEQVKQIKQFAALGDIVSAQRVILDELKQEVGGVARAYGESLAGRLENTKNLLSDLVQAFGKAITSGFNWEGLFGRIHSMISWMGANGEAVRAVIYKIGETIRMVGLAFWKVLVAVGKTVWKVVEALAGMVKWFGKTATETKGLIGWLMKLSPIMWALRAVVGLFKGEEGGTEKSPLAKAMENLKAEVASADKAFADLWETVSSGADNTITSLRDTAKEGNDIQAKIKAAAAAAEEEKKVAAIFGRMKNAIGAKFFSAVGRGDLAKKLQIRNVVAKQIAELAKLEKRLSSVGELTDEWKDKLGMLRAILMATSEAENAAVDRGKVSDLKTVAAGFNDRFAGMGRIRLDASLAGVKTQASENTAKLQLTTLEQIRDLLEAGGGQARPLMGMV